MRICPTILKAVDMSESTSKYSTVIGLIVHLSLANGSHDSLYDRPDILEHDLTFRRQHSTPRDIPPSGVRNDMRAENTSRDVAKGTEVQLVTGIK